MYFILFIAFTLLVTVGYSLGRKRNLEIAKSIGKTLEDILIPFDQNYTWIGGSIGFCANYINKDSKRLKQL